MGNLIISFNVIMPLFLSIILGYFIRKIGLFDEETVRKMNNVTFKTFFPIMLFNNVYSTSFEGAFNIKLIIFAINCVLISFISMCIIIPLLEKDNKKRGVLIQTIFRSNFILFALPITTSLFGKNGSGVAALLIAIIIPIFNFLAVVVLEIFRDGNTDIKKIIKGIITNPLILGCFAGIAAMLFQIRLPIVLEKTINDLSNVATPLALVILGASFRFGKIKEYTKQLLIGVIGRLVLVPGIFLPIAINAGFRNIELTVIIVLLTSPTATSSFVMAEQMGGDGELAGQLVIFTSAFSIITMFLWIFFIKQCGYI
ncbi:MULTISPECIES: AEC family transporter [unclassified Clostridium]|uniref:AEC family transporter n=1 Tax=unclassified Clostridium TaxID=2614128 RepID=UPI0002976A7F|nr:MULTISPECIES: AEC family transporter [unclassified Clostridium]EKQ56575.1 MAG: putative permease [Clostridium sp. Maddingley MBC34-26]